MINYDFVPAVDKRILADKLLKAVKTFMENPENQARFEEWKKQQAEKEATAAV